MEWDGGGGGGDILKVKMYGNMDLVTGVSGSEWKSSGGSDGEGGCNGFISGRGEGRSELPVDEE